MTPLNEQSRPPAGTKGAALQKTNDTIDHENNTVTTAKGEDWPEPTPVDCWINGGKLAWWCAYCDMWHGNSHDPRETKPITRCAPHCWGDDAGEIRLVVQGSADAARSARMARQEPPEGLPHPGRWVKPETVNEAIFMPQARWCERLILRSASSTVMIEACERGLAVLKGWLAVSDNGLNMVRRPRLMAATRQAYINLQRPPYTIGQRSIHHTPASGADRRISPREMRQHLTDEIRMVICDIRKQESSWPACRRMAWGYRSCTTMLHLWRGLGGSEGAPVREDDLWEMFSPVLWGQQTVAQAIANLCAGEGQ
jgi:hypothetical protein